MVGNVTIHRSVRWAILTGEYPPHPGGVADYTRQVATGLAAAGDVVTVFAPQSCGKATPTDPGVSVVRLPDHFGPYSLASLGPALDRFRPDRVLVQYVPHVFGYKAMNLPFATWLARRARRTAPVWVMFHEVAFPFRWRPIAHAVLASTHRVMAHLVAGAADRVFVSVPAWDPVLRAVCPRMRPAEWLPIPSNIPVQPNAPPPPRPGLGPVIGHFGTYGEPVTGLLEPTLQRLLAGPDRTVVLLGRGGPAFRDRLIAMDPRLRGRVDATGDLPATDLPARLRGCDILVQPFVDGISSRRTSAMAGLGNSVPVVSNLGPLSEPLWAGVDCLRLAPRPDPIAVADAAEAVLALPLSARIEMGRRAAALYRERFGIENTLARLRTTP
jgi:glycosyltransferase involved in cell wall biosynthesis